MEPNKFIQKLKNEDGAALVLAMMVLMVLSILGAMVGTLTVGSYRLSANNQDYNSAYYIAEAGANMAYEEIKSEVENLATDPYKQGSIFMAELEGLFEEVSLPEEAHFTYETNEEGEPYFQEQSGEIPKASVKVISESPHTREGDIFTIEYTIQSTGIVAGKEREVEKPFKVTWVEKEKLSDPIVIPELPEGFGVIADSLVEKPNSEIKGKYKINKINLEPYRVIINNFMDVPSQLKTMDNLNSNQSSLTIKENSSMAKMVINNSLTIDIGDKDVYLVLDDLEINNNITVHGKGKLNIYVKNSLKIGSTKVINIGLNNQLNQINILYSNDNNKGNNVNLNYLNINGSMFLKNSDIKIVGESNIKGHLLTGGGKIEFENGKNAGNTDKLSTNLIAPYAELNMGTHSQINGSVVAKEIILQNHAVIDASSIVAKPDNPFNSSNQETRNESKQIELLSTEPALEQ